MPQPDDLTGRRYGRLVVSSRAERTSNNSSRKRTYWNCTCDCGKTPVVNGDNLKRGTSTSCGCFRKEKMSELHSTHGQTNSRLYGIWHAMKSRCGNKNTEAFREYGSRGITVCAEWVGDYDAFMKWSHAAGYSESLTIDRIDNSLGYSPDNCRWVTMRAQSNNRRSNRTLTHNGETHNVTTWASILGISPKTIFNRIYSGKTTEEALTNRNNYKG